MEITERWQQGEYARQEWNLSDALAKARTASQRPYNVERCGPGIYIVLDGATILGPAHIETATAWLTRLASSTQQEDTMARITYKDLAIATDRLAHSLGREVGWKKGQVYISSAGGGHALYFVNNDGGGASQVPAGHVSTRELYDSIQFALRVMDLDEHTPKD